VAQVDSLADLKNLTLDPVNALDVVAKLPEQAVAIVLNLTSHWQHPEVAQAVWNLRDPFKADFRTLVVLAPEITPPAILHHDLVVFEEPLPTDAEITKIATELYQAASLPDPDEPTGKRISEVVRGLSAFAAEQAIALSLNGKGVKFDVLWHHKRRMIENTPGLHVYLDEPEPMGGIQKAQQFIDDMMHGPEEAEAFIYVEEIEKMLAGASSDHAGDGGVAKDALQTILTNMEENEWTGLIAVGPPGSGKSMFSRNVGAKYGRPTIAFDLGATRNSLVGASEHAIRAVFRVIKAIAGKRAYWIATCNKYQTLPPELKRRFTDGIWYFGMPDDKELADIWAIQCKRYGIANGEAPPQGMRYTGADVRNICRTAYRLRISLKEAAQYIVPVAVSDPGSISALEEAAHGRFLSASYAGIYQKPSSQPAAVKTKSPRAMLGLEG
jgi:hypothetical protein